MIILILLSGAALLFFLQQWIYKKYWDKGLNMTIQFQSHSAFEGETGMLTEVLENKNFLPLPFVHAKFEISSGLRFEDRENLKTSDQNYKNDIFSILFYQRITRKLPFKCVKRGYFPVRQATLVSTDLFYRLHLLRNFRQSTYFYVYPRQVNISRFEQPLKKMIGDMTSRSYVYPDPFEFRGLRNYTISDPMNTINWKASAKTGDLMVNQYNSTTSKRIVIMLNLEDETLIRHYALHEESIRLAATLAASLLAEGYPVTLITNGYDAETKEPLQFMAANGPAQTEDIYRLLARLDLYGQIDEFTPMLKKQMEEPDFATAGYILLSPCMKEELQEAYRTLNREAAAFWVTPLYNNMEFHLELNADSEVIRWEVEGYA